MPVSIFFCYAREDEALLKKLKVHLSPLQRQRLISVWHDRDISAGTEWEQEIKTHLDAAQIVLLLVSPDFIASDYAYDTEMQRALERHRRGEAKVIPIILRPVYWHGTPLGELQALPTDGKPVTSWQDPDSAFYDVVKGIRKVVVQLINHHVSEETQHGPEQTNAISPIVQQRVAPPPQEPTFINPLPLPIPPLPFPSPGEKLGVLRVLSGHNDSVLCLALSADGQKLVSGSADRTIKVWNLATDQEVRTLTGHTQPVLSVALSADGQRLASGSVDRTIKVWNLATDQEVYSLEAHADGVWGVALSANGRILVSGSRDQTIKVWDPSTGQKIGSLTGHTDYVTSVAISGDGRILVSGSFDQSVKVWDLSTGRELRTLTGHTGPVWSVALSSDKWIAVSGSADGTIKVWKLSTGQEVRTLTGHTNDVLCVAMSENGQTLVSGSRDQTIKVWKLTTGQEMDALTVWGV